MRSQLRAVLRACIFSLVLATFGKTSLAQVRVLDAVPVGGLPLDTRTPLDSGTPAEFRVLIEFTTNFPSTLQIWMEEYPRSGCRGPEHNTNGGKEFYVPPGHWRRWYIVAWGGYSLGNSKYPSGYLQPQARLNDDDEIGVGECLAYQYRQAGLPRPLGVLPGGSRPPPIGAPPGGSRPPPIGAPPGGSRPPPIGASPEAGNATPPTVGSVRNFRSVPPFPMPVPAPGKRIDE